MNIEKLSMDVLNVLRSRDVTDAQIKAMTPEDAFDEYCNWNGLIHWAPQLIDTLDALRKAEK